ncbi:MAG: 5'-methylthioadenosine/adenosylhomocysteine nucleosidase [Deinococcota bacterium]
MKIGIIGAMPEEVKMLLEDLTDRQEHEQAGFVLFIGTLEGLPVIIAQCGVGKVNAAVLTQLLIQQGATHIIFTGVAGAVAADLKVGDIVISQDAVQHDVDVTALGHASGEIPGDAIRWDADDTLRALAHAAASNLDEVSAYVGTIATGDQFIADSDKKAWLLETFGAACAEMEGASVAHVCCKWDIPFVIIRSISDDSDGSAEVDFRVFMPQAAERASSVVRSMLQGLAG